MTLVPLNYKNFVKNKVNNTVKIQYQDSDTSTYVYDNNIDSKSILNTQDYEDITQSEIGVDSEAKLNSAKSFFNSIIIKDDESIDSLSSYAGDYFNLIEDKKNSNITNDNLKLYNFRTGYSIERIEQTFLPQSFELQKKNYVKNNLYKAYQENFSIDFYNNLEFGFCNWNTINFFSQRYNSDRNHSNCIIWPNSKFDSTDPKSHQYDFVNKKDFNLSLYFNIRKNYNSSSSPKPECIFHVPDVISIFVVQVYNSNPVSYRLAVVLGNETKNKLVNITNISLNDNSSQTSGSTYITSDLKISNNRWYNLSINNKCQTETSRDIEIYIDGIKKESASFEGISFDVANNDTSKNSYICLGNKPNYEVDTNYEHVFYQLFARLFDKDISLGKNNTWRATGSELLDTSDSSYKGNITFEELISQNSESFHGEIHDIRIYKNTLDEEKIIENCNNTVNDLEKETRLYDLIFYVPVHYIPSYTNRKSSFNAFNRKINLRYDCIYNPILANTCGGLEVTSENYLIDFVNHTKPNVVIGGSQASYVYEDNISNSLNSLISSTDDASKIKIGKLAQSIYNENFNNDETKRNANLVSNLSYRNLLILPNDNGIQKVRFDAIKDFLDTEATSTLNFSSYNSTKFNSNKINNDKLFNVSVENIFNKDYFNKSISLDANIDNSNTTFDYFENDINWENKDEFPIKIDADNFEDFNLSEDLVFNLSNIIYHDFRVNDFSNLRNNINRSNSIVYTKRELITRNWIGSVYNTSFIYTSDQWKDIYDKFRLRIYPITESNPVLRNYKQDINSTGIDSSDLQSNTFNIEYNDTAVNYLKLPVPHSVLNKDLDSLFISIFDISSKMYNKSIKKRKFNLIDENITTSNNNLNLKLSDNGSGGLYRNNCLTEVATWNYVGHLFYKDGIVSLNRPELFYFGVDDFKCDFETDSSLYVHEINIPVDAGLLDISGNTTYDSDLRQDESAFNSEESFVYITDINLHDENLNVVARAKLARPAAKKKSDSILFRLKMDY